MERDKEYWDKWVAEESRSMGQNCQFLRGVTTPEGIDLLIYRYESPGYNDTHTMVTDRWAVRSYENPEHAEIDSRTSGIIRTEFVPVENK